jgi:lycopene beta-cyclase
LVPDVLVIGAGPAGTALAAALCDAGLRVAGLAAGSPETPWRNTYGIWEDELAPLGLTGMLGVRWSDCVAHAGGQELPLRRAYGLLDNGRLQAHLLDRCGRGSMQWLQGAAAAVTHEQGHSTVTTQDGAAVHARLVMDASGHAPALVRRPAAGNVAYQAAFGIVGAFSPPPVRSGQLVLMDYRGDHLTAAERRDEPPTFLYAMDLGAGRHFVEETSLAHAPAVALPVLESRLQRRLAHLGVRVLETDHVERCLFPMNAPVPNLDQPVVGYGAAASMVHPASGYQVGAALSRAPRVAAAIRRALEAPATAPAALAQAAWDAVWPRARLRNHYLYLFGLQSLLRFDLDHLQAFFAAFFQLPQPRWAGYLSNTLSTRQLMETMWVLFIQAPPAVRLGLIRSIPEQGGLLRRALWS